MMSVQCFILLPLIFLLSGCGYVPLESKVPDQLSSFQAQVTPGETSRRDVHERLGKPFIHDKALPVEVYRVASGRDAEVHIMPIPVWVDTEEVIIYALVIYNKDDIVDAVRWDVYQRVSETYDAFDDLPTADTKSSLRLARLQAYGYIFIAVKEGAGKRRKEFLLAPAWKSRESLHRVPPDGKCAVVFFYPQAADYFLDGDRIGAMPLVSFHGWYADPELKFVFSKAIVDEGDHELKMTTALSPTAFRRTFDCRSGRIFYAHPKLNLVNSEPWGFLRQKKKKYAGEISIDQQPLEGYEGWKRLLFYNGIWLGED